MDQPLICYKTNKIDDIKDYWSAQDQADILCLGLINDGVPWHIATAHYEHIPDYIASHRALLTTGHEARSILDAAANNRKLYGKTSAAIRDAIRDRTVSNRKSLSIILQPDKQRTISFSSQNSAQRLY